MMLFSRIIILLAAMSNSDRELREAGFLL